MRPRIFGNGDTVLVKVQIENFNSEANLYGVSFPEKSGHIVTIPADMLEEAAYFPKQQEEEESSILRNTTIDEAAVIFKYMLKQIGYLHVELFER